MLAISDLSVSFRRYRSLLRQEEVARLSHITLGLAAGEVLGVIGSSGAGKSLLAHAILGLLPPNAVVRGPMRFEGEHLNAQSLPRLRGRRIALLPQQISHLDPMARVGRQIGWAVGRGGAKKGGVQERLAAVGLSEEVGAVYPHHLSGGMARRVMLAIAAAGNARLMIADEPTAGLDPDNRDAVLARLRGHADGGGAVLLITHDLIPALRIVDRVAILDEGRLVSIAGAGEFRGEGEALTCGHARALWRALPRNGFVVNA